VRTFILAEDPEVRRLIVAAIGCGLALWMHHAKPRPYPEPSRDYLAGVCSGAILSNWYYTTPSETVRDIEETLAEHGVRCRITPPIATRAGSPTMWDSEVYSRRLMNSTRCRQELTSPPCPPGIRRPAPAPTVGAKIPQGTVAEPPSSARGLVRG